MSFRGRGNRGNRGFSGSGGRGGRGGYGRGGGSGGFRDRYQGPPDEVQEVGEVSHPCEDELVCKCTLQTRVPYFNATIYLENKQEIGKIDEILGPITDFYFSVKLSENMKASSFKKLQKLFIDGAKTLPLEMFTNPRPRGGRGQSSRGGGRGRGRGDFGGRGGRGGFSPRGGRGGFSPRGGRGGFSPRGGRGGFNRGGGRGRGFGGQGNHRSF